MLEPVVVGLRGRDENDLVGLGERAKGRVPVKVVERRKGAVEACDCDWVCDVEVVDVVEVREGGRGKDLLGGRAGNGGAWPFEVARLEVDSES